MFYLYTILSLATWHLVGHVASWNLEVYWEK